MLYPLSYEGRESQGSAPAASGRTGIVRSGRLGGGGAGALPEPRGYGASRTDRMLPAGSRNQAIVGPWPREMPRSSVLSSGSS